jgi:hypothetical protein
MSGRGPTLRVTHIAEPGEGLDGVMRLLLDPRPPAPGQGGRTFTICSKQVEQVVVVESLGRVTCRVCLRAFAARCRGAAGEAETRVRLLSGRDPRAKLLRGRRQAVAR